MSKDHIGVAINGVLYVKFEDAKKLREGWDKADEEIEKLRAENAKLAASNHAYLSNYQEAADEIEKLRAALRRIIDQSTETFFINPEGGANIVVEGHDRFAFEVDVKALLNIARAALGEKE
jgi:hypothetical protein